MRWHRPAPAARRASVAAALALLVAAPASAGATSAFTNFEPSTTPGVTCPGSTRCTNTAAEPAIRADRAGRFFAASENGLGGGTLAWRSADGGRHYTALPSPNGAGDPLTPAGGDVDVAVAPDINAGDHYYNVYVASLNLASIYVSTSSNGGRSWTVQNPVASFEKGANDREWIAADEASKVCISYHDAPQGIPVDCSYNAGRLFAQHSNAIDAAHAYQTANNSIGNLAIDQSEGSTDHTVYQIYSAITSPAEVACAPPVGTCGYHGVYMGVSTDGGRSFTDHAIYVSPDATVSYGSQFPNVSVDNAGNVYAVFSDGHDVFFSYSTTRGRSWSAPVRLNAAGTTAIMPWSSALGAGKIDVVWYGSTHREAGPVDSYPATATWKVEFAQNLHATTAGSAFTTTAATPVVHMGGVCLSGIACTGNRDLYDDFGVAASPTTGLASIVYSDDQFHGTAASPPAPGCTAGTTNTSSCDHTALATQVSGTGIK